MERANDPNMRYDPVSFDIATGIKVRVEIDEFWEQLSDEDLRLGHRPNLYFAIRVYSDEDSNPRRMIKCEEFRAGSDFDQECLTRLLPWLCELANSRHRFTYDRVEEFLEELSAKMDEFAATSEDAATYLYRSHGITVEPETTQFEEDILLTAQRGRHDASEVQSEPAGEQSLDQSDFENGQDYVRNDGDV